MLHFVVSRFQLKERDTRIGSLITLRHFVNAMGEFLYSVLAASVPALFCVYVISRACSRAPGLAHSNPLPSLTCACVLGCADNLLEDKKPLIMSSVITLVNEADLAVKKAIMQLIVSMSNMNYLQLEGGQTLVKFIAKQCALEIKEDGGGAGERKGDEKKGGGDAATATQIRCVRAGCSCSQSSLVLIHAGCHCSNAGNHILHVMATKVVSTHKVLWPYLLEMVNDQQFTNAMTVLAG